MLIETIRRFPNHPIVLPLRNEAGEISKYANYYFIPSNPDDEQSPHVAEVTQKDHIKYFLSLDMYSPYEGDPPKALVNPVVTSKPIMADAAGRIGKHPKPVPYGEPELKREIPKALKEKSTTEQVEELRGAETTTQLRQLLTKNTYSKFVMEAALAEEKSQDASRATWCNLLETFIKA